MTSVTAIVALGEDGHITKASMAGAREKLSMGFEYAEDKILAVLAGKKHLKPGEVVVLSVQIEVKFAVKGK